MGRRPTPSVRLSDMSLVPLGHEPTRFGHAERRTGVMSSLTGSSVLGCSDESQDAVGEEPGGPNGRPAASDLGYLHDPSGVRNRDAAPGAGRQNVVGLCGAAAATIPAVLRRRCLSASCSSCRAGTPTGGLVVINLGAGRTEFADECGATRPHINNMTSRSDSEYETVVITRSAAANRWPIGNSERPGGLSVGDRCRAQMDGRRLLPRKPSEQLSNGSRQALGSAG